MPMGQTVSGFIGGGVSGTTNPSMGFFLVPDSVETPGSDPTAAEVPSPIDPSIVIRTLEPSGDVEYWDYSGGVYTLLDTVEACSVEVNAFQTAPFTATASKCGIIWPVDLTGQPATSELVVTAPTNPSDGEWFLVKNVVGVNGAGAATFDKIIKVDMPTQSLDGDPAPQFAVIQDAGSALKFTWSEANSTWLMEIFVDPLTSGSSPTNPTSNSYDLTVTTDGQTTFALTPAPANAAAVRLFVNGVKYFPTSDFTISGSNLTWLDNLFTLKTSDHLEVVYDS